MVEKQKIPEQFPPTATHTVVEARSSEEQFVDQQYVGIRLDAPAIDTMTTVEGRELKVLATITPAQTGGGSYHRSQNARGRMINVVRDGGKISLVETFQGREVQTTPIKQRYRDPGHKVSGQSTLLDLDVTVTPKAKGENKPTLRIAPHRQYTTGTEPGAITVTAAEEGGFATEQVVSGSTVRDTNERFKRRRWIRRIAAAAMIGVIAHGAHGDTGAIDTVHDIRHQAGADVVSTYTPHLDTLVDKTGYKQAIQEVSATMQDLDAHNTDAIRERAEAFKEKYADQIMPADQTAAYRQELDKATTNDEVLAAANKFSSFYGKNTTLLAADITSTAHGKTSTIRKYDPNKNDTEDLRWTVDQMITAYSPLPNSIIKDARFTKFELGTPGLSKGSLINPFSENGHVAGMYDNRTEEGSIVLGVMGDKERALFNASGTISTDPQLHAASQIVVSTAIHELGHAAGHNIPIEAAPQTMWMSISFGTPEYSKVDHAMQKVTKNPDFVSSYAASESKEGIPESERGEHYGEDFEAVFNVGGDKVAHPDERRSGSFSAKTGSALLIDYARKLPGGLADYIAAQNLIQRPNAYNIHRGLGVLGVKEQ